MEVFREVRRVLRDDATLWVEYGDSYENKQPLGQHWKLAWALQDDGWYLRSEIIWARPNPMPESVTDRPTKAHSTVFLLSKSPRYFYDQEAMREAAQLTEQLRHAGRAHRTASERQRMRSAAGQSRSRLGRMLANGYGTTARHGRQRPLRLDDPHRANPLRPLRNLAAEAREPDDPGGNV